jgi:hypothetical protein
MRPCDECGLPAKWVRATQFSGNHFFCEEHAQKEKDFGQVDPSYFVWRLVKEVRSIVKPMSEIDRAMVDEKIATRRYLKL